ncbi:NADAR family protein [Rhodocytophaga rosea]|uniref:NADAR family protein n=1 Tax=Rhodocytophaga rosea TaxID=2704465 RepID=A0A6C0GDH1_9BACT|nr:NADAR family protein [Rhodocytophaga rosea]QHT66016.1 NADAR family protein [Rhodocytophaga rosea]
MKYDINWLLTKHITNDNEKLKYIFFWGHQPKKDGRISESCFSQWWPAPFIVDNITYKTAEHYMMAEKARLFGNEQLVTQIIDSQSPAEAKKLGRMISNFDEASWNSNKYQIVCEANYYKFSQHPDLKTFLLNTGNRILVEASPVDTIWGIGMAKTDENIYNPVCWKGENLLGFALMEVRDRFQ